MFVQCFGLPYSRSYVTRNSCESNPIKVHISSKARDRKPRHCNGFVLRDFKTGAFSVQCCILAGRTAGVDVCIGPEAQMWPALLLVAAEPIT